MLTFYDSGIGGLTVVKEYLKLKPNSQFQYYADFDILPMGDKSKDQILERIKSVTTEVFKNSNLIILACNTASVNTIRELQQNWLPKKFPNKQILSISKPITEFLELHYSKFKKQKLVVLATRSTINTGFYQEEFYKLGFENVTGIACPGLCDLIEDLISETEPSVNPKNSKLLDNDSVIELIRKIENPRKETNKISSYLKNLDLPENSLILLACTHYPIIKNMIKSAYPKCVIIDPSEFIAKQLVDYENRHFRC
jgi:glutamate racemase